MKGGQLAIYASESQKVISFSQPFYWLYTSSSNFFWPFINFVFLSFKGIRVYIYGRIVCRCMWTHDYQRGRPFT
jgi:hypothetical protein